MKINFRKGWFRVALLTTFLWTVVEISFFISTDPFHLYSTPGNEPIDWNEIWSSVIILALGYSFIWFVHWAINWLVEGFISSDKEQDGGTDED